MEDGGWMDKRLEEWVDGGWICGLMMED